MEHRDSPDIEPDLADQPRSSPRQRFAKLVESPAARKVALPRLMIFAAVAISLLVLLAIGGSRLIQSVARWVDHRPEHQIKFSRIELVPEPDPWIKGGRLKVLEEVRVGAGFDETIPLLDLDLKELEKAFRRYFWVKDVKRIDRSRHGRLIVELVYRQPVAVVPFPRANPPAFVIDEEAVVLPDRDIEWTRNEPPYMAKGISVPLLKILQLPDSAPMPRLGVPWKRKAEGTSFDDPDPTMLRAARLARFLQEHRLSLKSSREVPNFQSIYLPYGPDKPFFLSDAEENLVCWGKAPGVEKPGEASSEARWEALRNWIQANGPLRAKRPDCLFFDGAEARLGSPRKSSGRKN